jgi:uncharacterized membrane protein
VGLGLLESFLVYVLALVASVAGRVLMPGSGAGPSFGVIALLAFMFSLVLGLKHSGQGRARTAAGVILGTFLWPAIAFALLAWAFEHALSHAPMLFGAGPL